MEATPMPTDAPRRRFTLLDGMTLIAATALAIAWERPFLPRIVQNFRRFTSWTAWETWEGGVMTLMTLLPFVALWTLALILLRLRRPRPALRRLARQPGATACLTAAIGLAVAAANIVGVLA